MTYLIVLLLIILLLIIPIEFRIENKIHRTLIKIRVAYIFTFYFDYTKFIKSFLTSKDDRERLILRELIENSRKLKSIYPILKSLGKHITVEKFRIINRYSDSDPMVAVANYTTNAFISDYIHGLFGKVLEESYEVSNELELDVDFLCISKIRLVNTIIVFLEHINKIPLLIKRAT